MPILTTLLASFVVLQTPQYSTRDVQGWKLHIRKELLDDENRAETEKAVRLLEQQLAAVKKTVPNGAVAELVKVPLYFSPTYPKTVPSAAYHPGAKWLQENGRDPAMVQSIEFTNIAVFEPETRRMPAFALHELAHAFHDRVLPGGFQNPEIIAAFEKAKAGGVYDSVPRKDAEGKITLEKAYGMNNPMEYFAESTEAFFFENDFYPFTSLQLKQVDPVGHALVGKLWNSR
ncbi:MAG TPA: hypothetical protein PLH94_13805 [Fimbriimonadaceae bacterium]|nr:hypothetical protein [Fimbriimonadaceae bacterium]